MGAAAGEHVNKQSEDEAEDTGSQTASIDNLRTSALCSTEGVTVLYCDVNIMFSIHFH